MDDMLIDMSERGPNDPEWEAWAAANPELAEEALLGWRVRQLVLNLQSADIAVPVGFEARLMARIHQDSAFRHLFELAFQGFGQAFVDLINALFGLLPEPQPMRRALA